MNSEAHLYVKALQTVEPGDHSYTVFLKSRRRPTPVDEVTKEFLKEKPDLNAKVSFFRPFCFNSGGKCMN